MDQLQTAVFWVCLTTICLGGLFGLIGVWISDFWEHGGWRLLLTDIILAGTSLAAFLVLKFVR